MFFLKNHTQNSVRMLVSNPIMKIIEHISISKIKTKNAKNGVTSAVYLALHKDLISKTPKREVRLE